MRRASDLTAKMTFTVNEAAGALGLSRSTLYKLIKAGELATFTWCGRTLIRADVLQRAVDRASGRIAA
jgi:excisionase family DNA binding protein